VLTCSAFGSTAGAVVTGISDEHIDKWSEAAWRAFNATKVNQVRLNVAWDVVLHSGTTEKTKYEETVKWVKEAQAHSLKILISFDHNSEKPPSSGVYAEAVAKFREDPNFKNITEYTAWNEPNHVVKNEPGVNPAGGEYWLAADYWYDLNSICHIAFYGPTCTVAAGDFSDEEDAAKLKTYIEGYKKELTSLGVNPGLWAFHVYKEISTKKVGSEFTGFTTEQVEALLKVANPSEVWLTEAGGVVCIPETGYNGGNVSQAIAEEYQNAEARNYVWLSSADSRFKRAYYYELAAPSGGSVECNESAKKTGWDFFLMSKDVLRPAYGTVFPGALEGPDAAYFADASASNTISYWSWSTTNGWQQAHLFGDSVAAGTSPANVTLNGTPYVFFVDANREDRISDWSWTPANGWQQGFLETDPVAAGSSPSAVLVNGTIEVYFADAAASNSIAVVLGSGSSWQQSHFFGDPVAANSSPSAICNNGTAEVYFADASKSDTITVWVWGSTLQQSFFYGDPVAANSSPSAVSYGGTAEVYFADASKSDTITVWVWGSTLQQSFFYGDSLPAGSSPDAIVKGGELQIYFVDASKSNTLALWKWASTLQETFFYGDGLAAGSTPSSVVATNGATRIYFVDATANNTMSLWEWGTSLQQIRLYGAPVMSSSSPSADG
jgi:hypothetical protein